MYEAAGCALRPESPDTLRLLREMLIVVDRTNERRRLHDGLAITALTIAMEKELSTSRAA